MLGARRTQHIAAIAKQIEEAGGTALSHELDVTDLKSFKAFVAAAQNRFGSIDVLVNNAGVMPLSFMAELRVDDWNRMIDVNLRGVLNGIAAVLPIMSEHIAQAIGFAISQPENVDVNELIVRPTAQG